jgi:hypothetical protein
MIERLDAFEGMLKIHSGGAVSSPKPAIVEVLPRSTSAGDLGGLGAAAILSSPAPELLVGGLKSEAIQEAVARMKLKAMLPQQLFLQQLEDYREVDPGIWNTQFAAGFRERVAPLFMAEVFSTGKTGERWARDFVRDHGLAECHPARELVASLSALDTMIMTDREKGLLNRVSVERLARKAYALARAFRLCQTEADWRRPKGKDGNSWKTKIDWESARRIDPMLGDDGLITIPSVDEEVRKEMDREASLLKARAKLDARGSSSAPKDPDL